MDELAGFWDCAVQEVRAQPIPGAASAYRDSKNLGRLRMAEIQEGPRRISRVSRVRSMAEFDRFGDDGDTSIGQSGNDVSPLLVSLLEETRIVLVRMLSNNHSDWADVVKK